MPHKKFITSRPVASFLLGLIGTLVIFFIHLKGFDQEIELQFLSVRMRHAARPVGTESLLHVDIDDNSLDKIGRWPWPRKKIAAIIDVLTECGARTIVLDIIFPDPQKVRYVSETGEIYGGDESEIITSAAPVPVFDDAAMADSVKRGANVYLPMHLGRKEINPKPIKEKVREALAARPNADFSEVLDHALSDPDANIFPEDRQSAAGAYLRHRGVQALKKFGFPAAKESDETLSFEITPPLAPFAHAAYGSGFVNIVPDIDGIVRRIPLLGLSEGLYYPQLSFAAACRELARTRGGEFKITSGKSAVSIDFADNTKIIIPLDDKGKMLIRWTREDNEARRHIPAASVYAISNEEDKLRKMDNLAQGLRVKFLRLGQKFPSAQLEELYWSFAEKTEAFDQAYKNRIAAQRRMLRDMLYRPSSVPNPQQLEKLKHNESNLEKDLVTIARKLVAGLRETSSLDVFLGKPAKGADSKAMDSYKASRAKAAQTLAMLDALPAERQKIEKSLTELTRELKAKVAGKTCFVGSNSTSAADFVPTPINRRTPGVVVNANAFETILTGRFVTQAPLFIDLLVILTAGILISLAAATRPVIQAGIISVCVAFGCALFNDFILYSQFNVLVVMVAPLVTMVASFLLITAYRQLTEERAKRQIRSMFAHALSPVLVDRLLEDPDLARLGGHHRTLSCMFSDLAGFTAMSERMGPQKTVGVLNRYFDGATEIIQNRWGGYLNKFLGDGIFSFFGAPVTQQDQATRALMSALDCQFDITRLNNELASESAENVQLALRIGITTGQAMVGNCGSSQRMDYTAIGECVNLASRLESANKFFGTRILVESTAWESCVKVNLLARPLGEIGIIGVQQPVIIWNVVGYATQHPPAHREAFGDFARALELFKSREFPAAHALFQKVLDVLPDDKPAQVYLELCSELIETAPSDDWEGKSINSGAVTHIACSWLI